MGNYLLFPVSCVFCTDLEGGERLNISLEYYKVFYQAAATGSITMAAETLCISQPAVSQAVKHLERELASRHDQRRGTFHRQC